MSQKKSESKIYYMFNKMTSEFFMSVLLLTMNFVITLSNNIHEKITQF